MTTKTEDLDDTILKKLVDGKLDDLPYQHLDMVDIMALEILKSIMFDPSITKKYIQVVKHRASTNNTTPSAELAKHCYNIANEMVKESNLLKENQQ